VAVTTPVSGLDVAERLRTVMAEAVIEATESAVTIDAEHVHEAALFLRDDPQLDCKYLNSLTAVDWIDYFEVVYHLSSLAKNTLLCLKARASHEKPVVPSVANVWLAAALQEREAFDLMGIVFSEHPGLKRIFLWEGFPGHPLRKDFLALQGGFKPGLQRFPFEFPEGQRQYPSLQSTQPSAPSVPRLDRPPEAPFPVEDASTEGERVSERVRAEEAAPSPVQQPQGAGSDPAQAGGTNPHPEQPIVADDATKRADSLPEGDSST